MTLTVYCRTLLAVLALGAGSHAAAQQDDDDLVIAPEELVFCTVCHGVQMMGNRNINAPRLSGMDDWYVRQQLESFRKGWRGTHSDDLVGMEMRPMATVLNEQQVAGAAKFVSMTRSPEPATSIDGDATSGKSHYTSCGACHGVNAEGNEALGAPALTGLDDWYLVKQLENYRDGVRGSNAADTYGAQMRASTQLLGDDKAIADVVSYISTLPNNQGTPPL